MSYYIGVDGGGTKTAYALFDENKNILSTVKTRGSNHEKLIGSFDEATDIIAGGIKELLSENGGGRGNFPPVGTEFFWCNFPRCLV